MLVLLLAFGIWRAPKWFKMKAVYISEYTSKGEVLVLSYNNSIYIDVDDLREEYIEKGIFVGSGSSRCFPYILADSDKSEKICVYSEYNKLLNWLLWCEYADANDEYIYVDNLFIYVKKGFVFPDYRKDKISSIALISIGDEIGQESEITITDEEKIKTFLKNAVSGTDFTEFMSHEEGYDKSKFYRIYINYENFLINEEIGDLSKENTIFEGVGHFQAKTEENPDETTAEDENTAENTAENTEQNTAAAS